jgi:hypothetical protein
MFVRIKASGKARAVISKTTNSAAAAVPVAHGTVRAPVSRGREPTEINGELAFELGLRFQDPQKHREAGDRHSSIIFFIFLLWKEVS